MRDHFGGLTLAFALIGLSPGAAIGEPVDALAVYRAMVKQEAQKAGLPFEIADAVMAIESSYDPSKVGGVGEIGLMQVRPGTAAMLGFKGSTSDLAKPEINIHFGVSYLAGAWRAADGDLCRTLMKYRAGHGAELMTPRSVAYCGRALAHLAHLARSGSAFARRSGGRPIATDVGTPRPISEAPAAPRLPRRLSNADFWAVHTARIRRINAAIERRWRRTAAR